MRLPPRDRHLGWTPYAWLIYLVFFALAPTNPPVVMLNTWWARGLTILLFLPMYLIAYRLRGKDVLWPVSGMCLLGTAVAPVNAGACAFFIYASSFIGRAGSPALVFRSFAVLLVWISLLSWYIHSIEFWILSTVLSLINGGVSLHFSQQHQANTKLHLAQQEIERLAQTAERERIARDLHDLLGHTLSLVILKSELAGKLIATDPERAAREIRDVEHVGREALQQVRQAVRGYQAPGVEDELRRVQEMLATAGVQATLDVQPTSLTPGQTTAVVLALREAVTNVVRHANARNCHIALRADRQYCRLEVIDDGRGSTGTKEGSGLRGMRERIEQCGGTVERCATTAGRGTTVKIALPLRFASTAAEASDVA